MVAPDGSCPDTGEGNVPQSEKPQAGQGVTEALAGAAGGGSDLKARTPGFIMAPVNTQPGSCDEKTHDLQTTLRCASAVGDAARRSHRPGSRGRGRIQGRAARVQTPEIPLDRTGGG